MHLQPPHNDGNCYVAEWLVGMGIVGVEGYVMPVITYQWMNIIYIGPRLMIQHHNLGLRQW